jgi:hypothetical protein
VRCLFQKSVATPCDLRGAPFCGGRRAARHQRHPRESVRRRPCPTSTVRQRNFLSLNAITPCRLTRGTTPVAPGGYAASGVRAGVRGGRRRCHGPSSRRAHPGTATGSDATQGAAAWAATAPGPGVWDRDVRLLTACPTARSDRYRRGTSDRESRILAGARAETDAAGPSARGRRAARERRCAWAITQRQDDPAGGRRDRRASHGQDPGDPTR